MNRLQKKCLIATAGSHLLLVVILIVGPAFFYAHPKPDDSQLLDVIPSMAIDAALSSGVKNAQPPPPAPVQPQQPPTPPTPPTPVQPQVPPTPPAPTPKPEPAPSFVQKVETFFKPEPKELPPDDLKPVDTTSPAKPKKPHKIEVDLKPVTRTAPKNSSHASQDQANAEAKAQAEEFRRAASSLQHSFKPATTVDMPGTGSVSYANYASIIRSRYTQAWEPPTDAANDEANTRVKIVVGSDGTVISAEIIQGSGDDGVDQSVQHTLDRVHVIAPFPDGATEKEKTFIINFNLKAKRMLG
jgi:protein TonB